VIIAALKLLEERERIYQGRFEELRREINIGLEEAERGELIDADTVFNNLYQIRWHWNDLQPFMPLRGTLRYQVNKPHFFFITLWRLWHFVPRYAMA
jgi:hypothetical protein